jgi:homoserine dehydrogenase
MEKRWFTIHPKDHPFKPGRKRQYRIVLYGPLCRSTSIDKRGAGAEVTASGILLMLFELETYKLVVISKVN